MPHPTDAARARRAAVYVRISKDNAGTSLGVQRQERECRDLADGKGWVVVKVYVDNDLEASSGKRRPGYEAMLEDIRSGAVNAVVGWHSDRIYRRPDELEDLIELAEKHDVTFAAVVIGNIDLSTASGRLIARLLGAAAKYEVELKGERQAAQLRQRALAGLPTGGGSRPFGWEPGGMQVRPDEAAIVRDLCARAIAGESIIGLTEWLTEQGVPTVTGKPWHPNVVRKMLVNPRLAGIATLKGEVVGKAQWDALIDESAHRRLVDVLTYRGPARANTGRIALLPGIIWCGVCEFELVTFRQQREGPPPGIRSYGCRTRYLAGRPGHKKSCGRISVKAQSIEDDVAERVLADLARPGTAAALTLAAQHAAAPPTTVGKDLADAETRLQDLGRDYADALIGRTEFLAARDRLAARIADMRRSLGAPKLDAPYGDPAGLAVWWEAATIAKRQALLRQRIDRVVVGPHAGARADYDPTRVTVTWR